MKENIQLKVKGKFKKEIRKRAKELHTTMTGYIISLIVKDLKGE